MKTIKKLLIFTVLMSFAYNANAQGSATATVTASANIITTISIDNVSALAFGDLTNDAGTITLGTDGVVTDVVGGTRSIGGTSQAGGFNVNGGSGENFSLVVTSTVLTNEGSGAETMAIQGIKVSQDSAADVVMNTANGVSMVIPGGDAAFSQIKIGADLVVAAAQLAGNYTGTMSVMVAYE
jgi:hypothetical protein